MLNLIAQAAGGDQNIYSTFIMMGLVALFFYFILFRPEQKRKKKMEMIRSSMKKGDRVTAMGIVGHAVKVSDRTVVVESAGSKIEFVKAAVTEVKSEAAEVAE